MSSPAPSPAPPARKKPSALASCILLGLLLGMLGVVAGGGFWAYKKFGPKPADTPTPVASTDKKPPAPPATPGAADAKPTPPPTVAQTTPPKPPVIEAPDQPVPDPKPGSDPAVAATTPSPATPPVVPPPPDPPPLPPIPPVVPGATPDVAESGAKPPVPNPTQPDPDAPPPPAEPDPLIVVDPDPIVAPEPIRTLAEDDPQVAALKADADRRIDEAPLELYSDADKQKVRDAIRRSKRLTRLATLQFGAGAAALGSNERGRLKKALLTSEAEALLSDPQAVFFILGFADATGASDVNRRISQKRAAGVGDLLKSFKVPNASYAVGIGATTLLSAEKQSRNRATEVWVVLP